MLGVRTAAKSNVFKQLREQKHKSPPNCCCNFSNMVGAIEISAFIIIIIIIIIISEHYNSA